MNGQQLSEPALLGKIDLRRAGYRCKMLLGDLNQDGRMEMLMVQSDGGIDDRYVPHQVTCLTAYDLHGRMLWQVGKPDEHAGKQGSDYPAQIYDIDGDGCQEVLCVMNKTFLVLNGGTGEVKQSFKLPHPEAHDCIIIANLSGGPYARDVILKDRYRKLWAMNRDFQLLWMHEGNPGHFPWVYDFDGDGRDEVMAGYDYLDHDGRVLWSCRDLDDHADCIWVGQVSPDAEQVQIVVGGSVTVMYDPQGRELWRYDGSVESQHIALGQFRTDVPGLQVAGLDRIVRGDVNGGFSEKGKDGLFLLDAQGKELVKEDRKSDGWLTIIETLCNWDDSGKDYILAFRRGGGIPPTLYDGYLHPVVRFPAEGYAVHADLFGSGKEQVIIYNQEQAVIFGHEHIDLQTAAESAGKRGRALPQPKRLYRSTLYPGGEYVRVDHR